MAWGFSIRRCGQVIAAVAALALVAAACDFTVGTASGHLDPGFGNGTGAAVFNGLRVRTDDTMSSAVRQPDGRVVALGASNVPGPVITRYAAAGTLDPSFGDGGVARVLSLEPMSDVALAPDGAILVPGRMPSSNVWGVARFLPDGTPDPAFGTDGAASIDVAGASGNNWTLGVAATGDRTYVLAWVNDGDNAYDTIIVALRPDGSVDPAFGPDGTGFLRLTDAGNTGKIAVAPDGNLIVAYASNDWSRPTLAGVVRISPAGNILSRLDLATAGTATRLSTVDDMDLGADGSIVLAMDDFAPVAPTSYVVRITQAARKPKGALALDSSFGTGGAVALPGITGARVVLDSARRRVVVAGNKQATGELVATALAADGSPDPGWGTGGTATLAPLATPTTSAALFATPGGVLVAGDTLPSSSDLHDQYLLALTPAGFPDPSFGDGGWARTDIGADAVERFTAAAALPGGGVFVAGDTGDGVIAGRYGADGTPDADHPPALVLPDRLSGPHPVVDAVVAADGSAYVLVQEGANFLEDLAGGGPFGWSVIKFAPDGSLDSSFGDGGVSAAGGTEDLPRAIAPGPDGSVLVQDIRVTPGQLVPPNQIIPAVFDDRIVTLTPAGSVATSTTLASTSDFPPSTPARALAVGPAGDAYAVAEGKVWRLAPGGTVSAWGPLPSGVTLNPGDLAVDGAGRVIVLAPSTSFTGPTQDTVARFDPGLALDPTFGSGGLSTLPAPVPCCNVADVQAQPNGSVTVVHQGSTYPDLPLFVSRLLPTGQPDTSFSSGGQAQGTLRVAGNPTTVLASAAAGPDVLLAGNNNAGAVIARMNG